MVTTFFGSKHPIEVVGPKIQFSVDVPWEVFAFAPIANILRACSLEAPETVGIVIVVTSTWRPVEGPISSSFSWHQKGSAIDLRTGVDGATRPGSVVGLTRERRIEACAAWAARIKARLGGEYDVIFGDAKHIDHIHIEHDGQKAMQMFRTIPASAVV